MQGDREKCIAAGMDDYISKPVTAAKLKEVLLRRLKFDHSVWSDNKEARAEAIVRQGAAMMETPSSRPSGQPSKPVQQVIDWTTLESVCGEEGARELLEIFLDSTLSLFERMDQAFASRNGKQLKMNAHEMKGACASIGASDMSATSKELEQAALAEDWQQASSLLCELKADFEAVRAYCKSILTPSSG
jgi:HPt (histidine-containing phosphotransfer) domain-containing protein